MKQLLGVAEQETVGIGVEGVYLLFDAAQEPQLVKVAQREVGTLVNTPLTGLFVDSLTQQTVEWPVGKGMEQLTTRMTLLLPFLGFAHAVGDTLAEDALIEDTLAQLEEEPADARLAVR